MRRQFLSIVGEGLFEGHVNAASPGNGDAPRPGKNGRALMSVVTTAGRHPAGIGTRDVLAPAVREVSAAKGNSNRDSMATQSDERGACARSRSRGRRAGTRQVRQTRETRQCPEEPCREERMVTSHRDAEA